MSSYDDHRCRFVNGDQFQFLDYSFQCFDRQMYDRQAWKDLAEYATSCIIAGDERVEDNSKIISSSTRTFTPSMDFPHCSSLFTSNPSPSVDSSSYNQASRSLHSPDRSKSITLQTPPLDHRQEEVFVFGASSSSGGVAMQNLFYACKRSAMAEEEQREEESWSKPKRRNTRISKDPQSVAARHRRERISQKIRTLQRLVPGGTKMDTASMLDEAIHYVKFLKTQVHSLELLGFHSPLAVAPPANPSSHFPLPIDRSQMASCSSSHRFFPSIDHSSDIESQHLAYRHQSP